MSPSATPDRIDAARAPISATRPETTYTSSAYRLDKSMKMYARVRTLEQTLALLRMSGA